MEDNIFDYYRNDLDYIFGFSNKVIKHKLIKKFEV